MNNQPGWLNQQQALHQRKLSAWSLAQSIAGYDPARYRLDAYGTWIAWSEYGQRTTHGWEIDHELPKAHFPGAANQPANQQALHWKNNRAKSDKIDFNTLSRLLGGA